MTKTLEQTKAETAALVAQVLDPVEDPGATGNPAIDARRADAIRELGHALTPEQALCCAENRDWREAGIVKTAPFHMRVPDSRTPEMVFREAAEALEVEKGNV